MESISQIVAAIRSPKGKIEYACIGPNSEQAWLSSQKLAEVKVKKGTDVWQTLFEEKSEHTDIIVQEKSKLCYAAKLTMFDGTSNSWQLQFPEQTNNSDFGTASCPAEQQTFCLSTLQFTSKDCELDQTTEPKSKKPTHCAPEASEFTGIAECFVSIPYCNDFPPPVRQLPPKACDGRLYHRFWVSRQSFGMDFVYNRLNKLMSAVDGKIMDKAKLDAALARESSQGPSENCSNKSNATDAAPSELELQFQKLIKDGFIKDKPHKRKTEAEGLLNSDWWNDGTRTPGQVLLKSRTRNIVKKAKRSKQTDTDTDSDDKPAKRSKHTDTDY